MNQIQTHINNEPGNNTGTPDRTRPTAPNLKFEVVSRRNVNDAIETGLSIFNDDETPVMEIELKASFGDAASGRIVREELGISKATYLLPRLNKTPAGITGIYTLVARPEDAWLGWFGLAPHARRQGLGEVILEQTVNLARDQQADHMRIWTSLCPEHDTARKLYEKLGFSEEYYDPSSRNAGRLIRVFSKALNGNKFVPWSDIRFRLDCERHEIPALNRRFQ